MDIKDYLEQARADAYKAFECMEKRMETPRENKGNEWKNSPKWSKEDEEEFIIAIETLYEAGQHSSAIWLKSIKQMIAQ